MKIVIETDGSMPNTFISVNDKQLTGLKEFNFSMNPTKMSQSGKSYLGRCKMSQTFEGDFRSYYGDDFKKIDEARMKFKGGN